MALFLLPHDCACFTLKKIAGCILYRSTISTERVFAHDQKSATTFPFWKVSCIRQNNLPVCHV